MYKKRTNFAMFVSYTLGFIRKILIIMEKIGSLRALLIKKTSEIEHISPTSVRRVLDDKQNNDQVYNTFLLLEEEFNNTIDFVRLAREVERLVPLKKSAQK